MKYIITLIISLAVFTNIYAQSFVKENKIWTVASFDDNHNYIETRNFKFETDTLLKEIELYKKVYISLDLILWWEPGMLFKEDSNKVFANNYEGNYLQQIYDFNIEKGDTIYTYFDFGSILLTVDSVVVRNVLGTNRKHFFMSHGILWIEGIGSIQGPLKSFGRFDNGFSVLLCVHEDGILIYQNPDYPDCKVTSSAEFNSKNKKLIELFPTSSGLLRLSLLNGSKGEISIYSPEGKQLFKSRITERETEICSPAEGLMLFRFVNENGEVQTGKVVL